MNLLIDCGNSWTKWALYDAGEWADNGATMTSTELLTQLDKCSALEGSIEAIHIANVGASDRLLQLSTLLEKKFAVKAHSIQVSDTVAGIKNKYRAHHQLGVDRWLAAIGARHVVSEGDLVVVDAGTAVTVDLLTAQNEFQGGAILPGRDLMYTALKQQTANIDGDEWHQPQETEFNLVLGSNTLECVQIGVEIGLAGAIDRLIENYQRRLESDASVLVTGNGMPKAALSHSSVEYNNPNLVLIGMARAVSL